MVKHIGLGLMGLGTVGYGVYSLLKQPVGSTDFKVEKILIKDSKKRRPPIEEGLLTTDPALLLHHPHIDIIVEVMGGVEPSFDYIQRALRNKKHVVTANKLLLATHGQRLQSIAREEGVSLLFEASVCGGIPVIRTLKDSLNIFPLEEILGIVNGTTNYILTGMSREGLSFEEALKKAMELGYAEANPSSDITGEDAACKLAILSSIAFKESITLPSISYKGISSIQLVDLEMSHDLGYAIKLIAYARKSKEGLTLYVGPYLLHQSHPLAKIEGVTNGLTLKNTIFGDLFFSGPGAGMYPTAHSILSDILQIAKSPDVLREDHKEDREEMKLLQLENTPTPYYLRFLGHSSSFLSHLKEYLPINSYIEKPEGVALIIEEIHLHHLESLLALNGDKRRLETLYPVKGAE